MKQIIATVSELNGFIKKTFEANPVFSDIWIKGEISNYKKHFSGHIYLTLKDDGGVLKAVIFKSNAYSLTFEPSDGMKVMARGRVSVYEPGGAYQLYITEMLPDGAGELYVAYEKLKRKLSDEGIFDEEHKKTIPKYPERVGIITAPTGAAVRDIINVATRRFPLAELVLFPAKVQGTGAADSVCMGIEYFNLTKKCDVMIVGRGGGSIEDLWAFNEEKVAYAIYNSEIPIISAVGHEVDFTIADFAADLRAPTPSAAAELAVPSAAELYGKLEDYKYTLKTLVAASIERKSNRLKMLRLITPQDYIDNCSQRLDMCVKDMMINTKHIIEAKRSQLTSAAGKLDALSPLKVMMRGFALPLDNDGAVIKSVKALDKKKEFVLRLNDGSRNCTVSEK